MRFRRGSTGRGIGHITKNPMMAQIAVGENGINPPIIIYEWPSFEIVTILYEGTSQFYSHLSYSPDGDLLVSQGDRPDYLITVWNWKESTIMLRCESHSQEVYNVIFSSSLSGHIITGGAGHIKFWQMTSTFTGLKLKSQLGRFGRTEISDIIGILEMPDGKVVSGCEWGNILLWDNGLIKLEVYRKNKKSCHDKMITQFEYNDGELMSIGMDGWIRVWYYETIDQADPPDDNRFICIEPIFEFKISEYDNMKNEYSDESSMLMSIQKKYPNNIDDTFWYAQDANGGFWLIDLNTSQPSMINPPNKLFTCHAGKVNDIVSCPWGEFFATLGDDGRLNIYNYLKKKIIISHKFRDCGTCLIWFPCNVESTGSTIICAFSSGVLRMVAILIKKTDEVQKNDSEFLRLINVIKPHTKSITNMSVNSLHNLLVTGSEDSTIFIFCIKVTEKYPLLIPIGFINTPSVVTCMTWKPQYSTTILIGCLQGDCVEIDLPDAPQSYTTVSYELINCETKIFKFHSVKSRINRENAQLDIEKNKADKKQGFYEKMKDQKANNPSIKIDKQKFLYEDPQLPDIYIPEIPNRVLTINYSNMGTIYLTMAGFDAGFIYEYSALENGTDMFKEPIKCTPIPNAIDLEIRSCLFYENKYLIIGMEQGEIRVCRLKHQDFTDLSDYWTLPMHDTLTGYIPKIIFNYNNKMLFTCGHDGNIFSFIFNDDSLQHEVVEEPVVMPHSLPNSDVEDIEDADHLNLQQMITKNEENRIMSEAKKKKDYTLMVLRDMREKFRTIVEENNTLLKSQQISEAEFELDPRITSDLNNQLQSEIDLVHKKMKFKVEKCRLALEKLTNQFIKPITCIPFVVCKISNQNQMVHSLREEASDENFLKNYASVLEQTNEKKSTIKDDSLEEEKLDTESFHENQLTQIEKKMEDQTMKNVEGFSKSLRSSITQHKLGNQVNHLMKKYQARRDKMEKREQEWKILNASKPDSNMDYQKDVETIEIAEQTIGDYKLKIFTDLDLNKKSTSETIQSKYRQLLECRKMTHNRKVHFNEQLKAILDKKLNLQREILNLVEELKSIHAEIPDEYKQQLPEIFEINYLIEYPEKNLELDKYSTIAHRVKEARRIRKSSKDEIKVPLIEKEYEVLLLDEKLIWQKLKNNNKKIFPVNTVIHATKINIPDDVMASLNLNDSVKTTREEEMKLFRMEKKIYEQHRINDYISRNCKIIDDKLSELECERLVIQVESCYSELYQLTVHQELIILRDCEMKENYLSEKVHENLMAQSIMKQNIHLTTTDINNKSKEIAKLHEKIKELSSQFSTMISKNKFEKFLRRIFRKKYKQLRETEGSSTDTSSSDLTSEDDDISINSQEFELYHLNENVCPTGCDEDLYNMAFSMRSERHGYESQIKDDLKILDSLKRELEQNSKKLKTIDNSLNTSQQELLEFLQEKQRKLNQIEATVILNLDQMQHSIDNDSLAKIQDCVVFNKGELSRLHTRVGQLQQETTDQIIQHKKTQMHLSRMEMDCKYMEGDINRMNKEINEVMLDKFGRQISLEDLYEAVLRRLVIDVKSDMKNIANFYDKEIHCIKKKSDEQVNVLKNFIQENTEKLGFLKILFEEHAKLWKTLKYVHKSEESISKIEHDSEKELEKLETILKNQCQQKRLLHNEIRNLKLKSRFLPPTYTKNKTEKLYNKLLKFDEETKFDEINKNNAFLIHQSRIASNDKSNDKMSLQTFTIVHDETNKMEEKIDANEALL
ncbi:hypothetical protein PV327_009592 [Microctonus hyperodae]|uniref:Cilia- and flagella-associated protein 44 n=1 Tax=Microctonus hyperodae TaxID=165561 RepID=A0AA39CBL8_MICHY|nr:hypothetical protein PV327_009592 [Microctonus hyperodae]